MGSSQQARLVRGFSCQRQQEDRSYFDKFLENLQQEDIKHRPVEYFARQLSM